MYVVSENNIWYSFNFIFESWANIKYVTVHIEEESDAFLALIPTAVSILYDNDIFAV